MRKLIIFVAVAMLLVSCKKDMISENSNQADLGLKQYAKISDNALLAKSKEGITDGKNDKTNDKLITKQIKNSGSGTITYTPNGCGNETLRFNSDGTGNSTVLGFFTQKTTFCINSNTQQVIGSITGVGTTSNGNQILYTFVGTGIDTASGFTYQDYIFTGGTGKYALATGSMRLLYHVNTPSNYSYTGNGTITF